MLRCRATWDDREAEVVDVFRVGADQALKVRGPAPEPGIRVEAAVARLDRHATMRNHTATHLLHAALALGSTKWQTVWHQVLPAALPGILTGVILAVSRAIGEAAPLILVGATTFVLFTPGNITSPRDVIKDPSAVLAIPWK